MLCKHEDLKLIPDNQKKMIQWLMLAVLVPGVRTRASLVLADQFIPA